jgi:uroporphyrinogen decarboxylase
VKGNDHVRLKEFRRGRLVLDGGVNHMLLVKGSPKDVFKETRRVIDLFAPDGGLLIGPSQVFTEDIPPANIIALFEAALQ